MLNKIFKILNEPLPRYENNNKAETVQDKEEETGAVIEAKAEYQQQLQRTTRQRR